VRTDDDILPLVQTVIEASGDPRTLRIQHRPGESLQPGTKAGVSVDVVKLNALAGAGSGNPTREPTDTPAFALSIAGLPDIRLRQLDAEHLNVNIAGSGSGRDGDNPPHEPG